MHWSTLLSTSRPGGGADGTGKRTVFNQDYGRVLYSSAFRRLQDKTQVFPLGRNDYVRTRLTHSLEVANVGRALAMELQDIIYEQDPAAADFSPELRRLLGCLGDIVSAACLAHDIGNPPFGHSGETAIETAVRKLTDRKEYSFEGNAQGFRLLTRICDPIKDAGLNLTCATLGAFTKYPCTPASRDKAIYKKYGINEEELPVFRTVAEQCGLIPLGQDIWARHPLAFLMEAADDISYLVADIEDAYVSHIISYETAVSNLMLLAGAGDHTRDKIEAERARGGARAALRLARALTIGACISAASATLKEHYTALMEGTLRGSLMKNSALAPAYEQVSAFSVKEIYSHESVIKVEVTGFNVMMKLMELYLEWVDAPASPLGRHLAAILHADPALADDPAYRFSHLIDYVSGMTDSYALKTYGELYGTK